jgi:hypothetical protein
MERKLRGLRQEHEKVRQQFEVKKCAAEERETRADMRRIKEMEKQLADVRTLPASLATLTFGRIRCDTRVFVNSSSSALSSSVDDLAAANSAMSLPLHRFERFTRRRSRR